MFEVTERKFMLWALLLTAIAAVIFVLRPFLLSLTTGAIFAFSLFPFRAYLERRWRYRRLTSGIVIGTGFVLVVLAPIVLLSYRAIRYVEGRGSEGKTLFSLKSTLGKFVIDASRKIEDFFSIDIPIQQINSFWANAETTIVTGASDMLREIPDATVQVFIMVATLYAVLCKGPVSLMRTENVFLRRWTRILLDVTVGASRDVILANFLTGFVQASMVTGAAAVFTEAPLSFIFVFTFVVSFIPVIGAGPVAAVLGLMEIIQDNWSGGVGMIISAMVIGTADNFIRAYFISRDRNDSQFLNFVGTLGGIYIWGLAGLFIGPTIVSMSVRLIPKVSERLVAQSQRKRKARPQKRLVIEDPANAQHLSP